MQSAGHNTNAPHPSNETVSLLGHMAAWTDSRQPLPELLRALADEYAGRSRAAFVRLAERIEAGDSLADAVLATKNSFPSVLRRQLELAAESGDLQVVLPALAMQESTRHDIYRQMFTVLLYPVSLLVFSLLLGGLACLYVIPEFQKLYQEFALSLPETTRTLLMISAAFPTVASILLVLLVVLVVAWVTPGTKRFMHWLVTATPLLGRLWISIGHQSLCEQLAAYLAVQTPLPTALRGAACGLSDRNLARTVNHLATATEQGVPLSVAMDRSMHIERPLTTTVYWAEQQNSLAASLSESAKIYREQIDHQVTFLQRVSPPCLLLTIGWGALLMVIALLTPLVDLFSEWT